MIALRLNIRRDGTVCLVDADGRAASPDREFPSPHGFTYETLAALGARQDGDTVTLELANGRAVYAIVERVPTGVNVELVESELFDPPPIDETKAEQIAAERQAARDADGQAMNVTEARGGGVLVEEAGS